MPSANDVSPRVSRGNRGSDKRTLPPPRGGQGRSMSPCGSPVVPAVPLGPLPGAQQFAISTPATVSSTAASTGSGQDSDPYVRTSQLTSYLDEFANGFERKVATAAVDALRPILPKIESRFGYIETEVARNKKELDDKCGALAKDVQQLKDTLAIREANPFARVLPDARDPNASDATLLRLSVKNAVGIDAIKELASTLLDRIQVSAAQAKVTGPGVGKNFRIQFNGEVPAAARRAKKLVDSLRDASGAWEDVTVAKPTGGTEKVFIGHDRSTNQLACSFNARSLGDVVRDLYPHMDLHVARNSGVISSRWETIAELSKESDFTTIVWGEAADTNSIDKAMVTQRFNGKLQERKPRG